MEEKDNNALERGTHLLGNENEYVVETVLGSGGFGITYKVSATVSVGNIQLDTMFTLKEHFLKEACERDHATSRVLCSSPVKKRVENSLADFVAEARRLQSVKHPNIVSVSEVFTANDTAYYVMEFINGSSLRSYVEKVGVHNEAQALAMITPILDAVNYLHQNRMTHLDIKPDNVMLREGKDSMLTPVLIDFGLSKHYDESGKATSTVRTLGCSDGYAPPEQYAGILTFTPQADIYSLGATLLFILTGKHPDKSTEIDTDVVAKMLPETVSEKVRNAIIHAMEPMRKNRTESVADLAKELGVTLSEVKSSVKNKSSYGNNGSTEIIKPNKPSAKRWLVPLLITLGVVLIGAVLFFVVQNSDDVKADQSTVISETTITNESEKVTIDYSSSATSAQREAIDELFGNMIMIEGGNFTMGATPEQGDDVDSDEKPAHSVSVNDFYLCKYEVTQKLWNVVMGYNPSNFKGDNLPVECVSWSDCQMFINKLNDLTNNKYGFRLPAEAEWEYAARGGNRSQGYKYSGGDNIDVVAWYESNAGGETHVVGGKTPNELGLYDMSGNVWEWTSSNWGVDYNSVPNGSNIVHRGGCWGSAARGSRVASRHGIDPGSKYDDLGLRLAR